MTTRRSIASPPGMPAMMNNPYPIEFVDDGDRILLRLEEWDGRRVIHLNDDVNVDSQPATPTGYSVGVWKGTPSSSQPAGSTMPITTIAARRKARTRSYSSGSASPTTATALITAP